MRIYHKLIQLKILAKSLKDTNIKSTLNLKIAMFCVISLILEDQRYIK